jgi:uncharacterized cupredoxin-like copper-binding protein
MQEKILIVLAGMALAASGCATATKGGSSNSGGGGSSPATSTGLDISMSEFQFTPSNSGAEAGKVTITAKNDGKVPHELVLLKTDRAATALPEKGGRVDEAASVGEIGETPAGRSGTHTFDLKPGKYVLICNLPGHYDAGMHGTLTVR